MVVKKEVMKLSKLSTKGFGVGECCEKWESFEHVAIGARWSVGGVDRTKYDSLVSINASVAA